nr:translation initiation factor IF-2-like isoform X1 [Rattus norvegicus]
MAATPLPCCDRTTWEWGIRDPVQDLGRSPRVGSPHSHFEARDQPGATSPQHSFLNKSSPERCPPATGHLPFHHPPLLQVAARARGSSLARSSPGGATSSGAGMRPVPQPRAAPRPAPPASPELAPRALRGLRVWSSRALPRPGAGAARGRLPGAPRTQAGSVRGGPVCSGGYGCEGRRPAGRARARLGRPHPHRGALRRGEPGGHELGRGARARAAAWPLPTRSLACAVPGALGPHAQPRPTPDPARTALRRHILQLAAARARRERASSQPPRRARRRLPPRPRARPGPFRTRPALTCSLAQLQTLAVGSRVRQRASQDGMEWGHGASLSRHVPELGCT